MSSRHDKDKSVNVQVLLRCRPLNDDEKKSNASKAVVKCNEVIREVVVSQSNAGKIIDKVFTFDKVFGPKAQQKDLYDQAIVPIVNEVLEGFNCTIFAYGQTGTGKTYTMEGECKRSKCGPNGELPSGAGVIPRAVKQIFDTLESQHAEYSVKVTFLELYNEEITDLLAPDDISKAALEEKPKKQLPLMEDGKGGVLVRGLEEEIVTNASEIFNLLERGSAKRRTAETLLNKQSSRSHSLFSITIHIKESTPEGEELIKCGKLNLVDLAGSENISRSGAREGRAREAGEINKSLLTLGRVINALVEHLGHIPYRDSKLTRLLRDSLGGRTKTCIIATVSPAVHCLEESLSTLDYAHRAKNIKNKPEVNQKMTKTTLIKDLYSEIERLKAEVYAAREKNGVYIPKERYYQEEGERKAMKEQIFEMGNMLKSCQKELDYLKVKFTAQDKEFSDLSSKLHTTEKKLNETGKLLTDTEHELKKCRYDLKERDFIIVEQKKTENALAHQACVLRSDLEKSLNDFALLSSKTAREDKLHADNRSVVNIFQEDLAQQISSLCEMVAKSVSGQTEQLNYAEGLCHSLVEMRMKSVMDIKKKVAALRASHTHHMEAIQDVVRLHKSSCSAGLEEISSISCANDCAMKEFLELATVEAKTIYDDLQNALSTHSKEMALFAGELEKRFSASIEHTRNIAGCTSELAHKLVEESKGLENFASKADELQVKSINEFQKTYEEHLKYVQEKFIFDMTNSFSNLIGDHKELFGERLVGLRDIVAGNKNFLDGHVSSMLSITTSAKRKWESFCMQAESDVRDSTECTVSKHCRMESLLEQCVSCAESAFNHWRRTRESVNEMTSKHAQTMVSRIRNTLESSEQHGAEIDAARSAVEQVVTEKSEAIIQHVDCLLKQEHGSISGILDTVKSHADTLDVFRENHTCQATSIQDKTQDIFENKYMDYEPTGSTLLKCDLDVPSTGVIESLKSKPIEELSKEFRKNNSFESFAATEAKPSCIARLE